MKDHSYKKIILTTQLYKIDNMLALPTVCFAHINSMIYFQFNLNNMVYHEKLIVHFHVFFEDHIIQVYYV